jgi:hypothetical protein
MLTLLDDLASALAAFAFPAAIILIASALTR